jgi:cytochrome P450
MAAVPKLNLSAIEYRSHPFESFGRLREQGPLVQVRMPIIGKLWLVTTYAACEEVLKNDKLFCRDPKNAGKRNFLLLMVLLPGVFRRLANNMIGKDEPDHRRLRSLVDKAFQRRSIEEMRPEIERIVDLQLDEVANVAAANHGVVDLVEHLARPVPLAVIAELLGLPREDRPRFRAWFSSFAEIRSLWSIHRVVPGLRKTQRYLQQQFAAVRQQPRPGLISALVEVEQAGDRLNDDELLSMVMLLLLAGHETTVHLLSTSILTLLQMPALKRELLADWSQCPAAVEELLRYNSPAQFAKPRFVTQDTVLAGQALKRGEVVMPALAAANADPARFDDPTEFQIDRPRNYHLDFGAGPHVCLGLKLARLETQIVLERLFTRWPELKASFELTKPDWSKRMGMRSVSTLNVLP